MAFKVLLVEDDNNLREIYEARLLAEGFSILTAKDGEEALVIAKNEKPDLIISDVMMPRISGFEMLDIMRNTDELKYTKVIMLTALGQAEDKTRANSLGADRYLVKSQVTLEDIVKAAHELTDGPSTPPPSPQPPAPQAPAGPVAPPPTYTPVVAPPLAAAASVPVAPALVAADPASVQAAPAVQQAVTPAPVQIAPTSPQPAVPAPQAAPVAVHTPAPATSNPVTQPAAPAMPAAPSAGDNSQAAARPAFMTNFTAPVAQSIAQPAAPQIPAQPETTDSLKPETTAEEKAEVDAQIANFANAPQAPAAAPSAPAPAAPAVDNAAELLSNAVHDLAANSGQPAQGSQQMVSPTGVADQPVAPPSAPTVPDAPSNNSVTIANKKIIQPLNLGTKPNINDLLAREEERSNAEQNPKSTVNQDMSSRPSVNAAYSAPNIVPAPPTSESTVVPNNISPTDNQQAPQPGGPVAAPSVQPPAGPPVQKTFDPNSIAL